ncbi:glycosyltransferase [Vibrio cholerae]|nr:glycosyltransferase [Vibrio cholerae]
MIKNDIQEVFVRKLTVIIPVYRGLEETQECINSLLKQVPEWCELVVINDCSPEPELTEWLRYDSTRRGYNLFENEQNLGFVETVNKGMQLELDNDVLLLNSDVEVASSDWLTRMRNAAYSLEKVASITPFSNNATICSFPNFCEDNELFDALNVNQIDQVFANLVLENELVEVPTGVGFCMYIKRDCLNEIGFFDHETFGKGYGEENDWCQRAKKKGWRNYHQLNVFVYHKGGVSFSTESDPRKEKALELLQKLHPNYYHDVQEFIQSDPAKKTRLLALANILKQSSKRKILIISHKLGGGVTQHVSELISYCSQNANFLILTPYENGKSVSLCLSTNSKLKIEFSIPKDYDLLKQLLIYLELERIHIHHTMGLPCRLYGLAKDLSLSYDMTIHDYYYINGNPTLTDSQGRFVSDNDHSRDHSCGLRYPIPVEPATWRANHEVLLLNADRVICPSLDVANRLTKSFQNLKHNVVVAYHPDALDIIPQLKCINKRNIKSNKVLILGALSLEKGADLLEAVAQKSDLEFHLLGYAYRPLDGIITHGPYELANVDMMIASIDPDFIWFPALWPETYSYTLSIALRSGIRIVAPNIGAFPERLRSNRDSIIYPWNINIADCIAMWEAIKNSQPVFNNIDNMKNCDNDFNYAITHGFYNNNYLNFPRIKNNMEFNLDFDKILDLVDRQENELLHTYKEKILVFLWRVRNLPVISKLARVIPIRYQKKLKRFLTEKPIYEIFK